MIRYSVLYKKRGIWKFEHLTSVRLSTLDTFELPLDSLVHYLPENNADIGPRPTNLFLIKKGGLVFVDYVLKPIWRFGDPKIIPNNAMSLMRKHRKQNPSLLPLKKFENGIRNTKTIIIKNYSILPFMYRYPKRPMARIDAWRNKINALVDGINDYSARSDRQQFLRVYLPTDIPKYVTFKRCEKELNRVTMNYMPTDDHLFLLELWRWLGDDRANSALNRLTEESVNKLNLVWTESGRYSVMNLGNMNKWRKDTDKGLEAKDMVVETTEEEDLEYSKESYFDDLIVNVRDGLTVSNEADEREAKVIQRRFLKFIQAMESLREVQNEDIRQTTVTESDADDLLMPVKKEETWDDVLDDILTPLPKPTPGNIASIPQSELGDILGEKPKTNKEIQIQEKEITITAADDDINPIEIENVQQDDPYSKAVVEKAKRLSKIGYLSGAEVKRMSRLSERYKDIPDPYGSGKKLSEVIAIDQNVIKSVAETEIPDKSTVLDKSMLKSTIIDFDKKYIKEVMSKDIMNAFMHLQKGGNAILDYKVETIIDAVSEYEIHTVRVQPVGGTVSTIKARVPKLRPDGTFKANGVNYTLRKQRADKFLLGPIGVVTYQQSPV